MKETIHMLILQHQILKAQKSLNHDEYCYHIKQFILTSANSYCNFHILSIYYVLYFPLGTSTLYFPCFSFFFIDHTWKQMLSISVVNPCFVKGRSFVSWTHKLQQLKIKSNTPCINIMYTAFQNSYSFLKSFPW